MKLTSINSFILAFGLAVSTFATNAFTLNDDTNSHSDEVIQLSVDANGNYHISFYADVLETSTAAQESHDEKLFRSLLTSRLTASEEQFRSLQNSRLTTSEERLNGLIRATEYFTKERPRSFSLKPRGERRETEEYGEVQSYIFCVYLGPALKSNSCIYTWFSVDEIDVASAFDASEIKYIHSAKES